MSKGNCESCKQKNTSNKQVLLIIAGFYVLISSIYGTVTFIREIINLVN